jgi:hypothetical protein
MERHWKRATQWAAVGTRAEAVFGAVEPAASRRSAGSGAGRPVGSVPRAQKAKGAVAGSPPWSMSAGWEVRAASSVGAAMVHWLGTGGDRATTLARRGTDFSHNLDTVESTG